MSIQHFFDCAGSAVSGLEQARDASQRNSALNALAYVDWDHAMAQAEQSDAAYRQAMMQGAAGRAMLGPLEGVPVSVKDLFNVAGMPTRAGTRATLPDLSPQQASIVTRLKQAGAIVFAKTNMHEIALGATGENSWTGDVCNPYSPAHQAGGSSSGSAVAVASGIGLASVGSDTGGSVRIPAAFCGVVGFKPSYQAIPLDGALHLSWTCDHAGPIARTVEEAKLLFEVLADRPVTPPSAVQAKPWRVGLLGNWESARLSEAVSQDFARVLAQLRDAGAQLVDLDVLAALQLAWRVYTPIVRAEAAWVHRTVLAAGNAASSGFSPAVLAPLEAGRQLTAMDYLDAMQGRSRGQVQMEQALSEVDVLLTPTSAVYPPLRGQQDVLAAGGATMSAREAVLGQTLAFSLYGLPALSLPNPKTIAARGFPLGLQVVANHGADLRVLQFSQWLESVL